MGESIVWRAAADLPGLATLRVEEARSLWRVFHDTYTVCSVPLNPGDAGSEWLYRGRHCAVGATRSVQLMEPGEAHRQTRLHGGQAPSFDVLLFDPSLVARAARALGLPTDRPHLRHAVAHDPRLHRAIGGLANAVAGEATRLERESRLARVLELLVSNHVETRARPFRPDAAPRAVARARALLHDRLDQNVTLGELEAASGLSRFHLLRAFQRATGYPPHQYQLMVRVWSAAHRLARGERPVDVASELGFVDQSHFGRHFRRLTGVPPGVYARSLRRARSG